MSKTCASTNSFCTLLFPHLGGHIIIEWSSFLYTRIHRLEEEICAVTRVRDEKDTIAVSTCIYFM